MLSSLPRIATVCLAILAVAFMGMSIAAYFNRPDPMAEINSPELANYEFTVPLGTESNWTVTPAVDGTGTPSSHSTAYAAILDAYKKEATRLSSEISQMTADTTKWRALLNEMRTQQQEDITALDRRAETLRQVVNSAEAQLNTLSGQLQQVTVKTTALRDETSRRRDDVSRLQHELEELRTDRYRLEEIRRTLTDRLVRLQLENQALDVRFAQVNETNE